jgi:hypothetical protein
MVHPVRHLARSRLGAIARCGWVRSKVAVPRAGEAEDVVVRVRAGGDEGPVAVQDEVGATGGELKRDPIGRLRYDARLLHPRDLQRRHARNGHCDRGQEAAILHANEGLEAVRLIELRHSQLDAGAPAFVRPD